jgi:ligand-binding sensor domain-containing protein
VLLSTDNGSSWTAVNSGLKTGDVYALAATASGAGGMHLFAGTSTGVFRSTNSGANWTEIDSGLTSTVVASLVATETTVLAGTTGGLFRSSDNGTTWSPTTLAGLSVNALLASPGDSGRTNFFAGCGTYQKGVFLSTDNGASWTQVNGGLTAAGVYSLAASGTNLFAGTIDGVFLSTDDGGTWTEVSAGLTNRVVHSLVVVDTYLYAGTSGGIFRSANNGATWDMVIAGLGLPLSVTSLAASDTNLFAGTSYAGVFRSSDNGASWVEVNSGLSNPYIWALIAIPDGTGGTKLFAGTYHGVFASTNNGARWALVTDLGDAFVQAFAVSSDGAGSSNLYVGGSFSVYRSTDNGTSWNWVKIGLIPTGVSCLAASGNTVCAGNVGGGVFVSTNAGATWTIVNTGVTDGWTRAFVASPNAAGGTTYFAGIWGGGVFRSTDNGASWTWANTWLVNTSVQAFAVSDDEAGGTRIFAGTNLGVSVSRDDGASWRVGNEGLTESVVQSLVVSGPYLFAGTYSGVFRCPLADFPVPVHRSAREIPVGYRLGQNYPNPFNPSTTLRVDVPERSLVSVKVYDLLGREISTLLSQNLGPGSYDVRFEGSGLPSGVYFCRMEAWATRGADAFHFLQTREAVLLK